MRLSSNMHELILKNKANEDFDGPKIKKI